MKQDNDFYNDKYYLYHNKVVKNKGISFFSNRGPLILIRIQLLRMKFIANKEK